MEGLWPPVIMLGVFLTILLIAMYNKFIKYRNTIEEQWSGIDVALRRRFNLLPNVVNLWVATPATKPVPRQSVTAQRAGASDKRQA